MKMTKREYKLFVSLKAMRGDDYAKDAILKLRKPIETLDTPFDPPVFHKSHRITNMRESIAATHQALADNEDFQQTLNA